MYPNGLDTTYYWQYGTTTAYGQQHRDVDAGAGTRPVVTTDTRLSRCQPSTTYHYRLVATNSDGTTYGYDYTTTRRSPTRPVNSVPPSVTGTAQPGAAR